jgi:hypothetical protein
MIINTERSHLKYWYGEDRTQVWRKDNLETTSMSVGGCSRKPMSFKAELIRTARVLNKQYPDLTLFMSGGLDSEMALQSFLAAGITPQIVTVRFPNDKNIHDIGPAMRMFEHMGLKYNIIDIDPEEFVMSGEAFEIGARFQGYSFYQQLLMKVALQYNAPMITIDEIELEKLPAIDWTTGEHYDRWVFLKKEDQDGVWRRFADATGIPALNNFYSYSPESILSFLQIPTVDDLVNDRIPGKLGWTSSKMKIYSHLGYNFRKRPKWHGVENYMHLWDYVRYNVYAKSNLNFNERNYVMPIDQLKQNLINGVETVCNIA